MIKQKLLFVLVVIGFQCVLNAQDYNQKDTNGKRHGQWRKFYEGSKQLRYEGTFEHGKEIGTFKFYGPKSGNTPKAIKTYTAESDILDVVHFRASGKKLSQGPMKARKRHGKWTYYHDDGVSVMSTESYSNDLLDGERTVFFPDGQIAQKLSYVQGKINGKEIHYSQKGAVIKEFVYVNDKLHGPAKIYDINGNLMREGKYKDNKKDGLWKFYKGGKLDKEMRFPVNKIGVQN